MLTAPPKPLSASPWDPTARSKNSSSLNSPWAMATPKASPESRVPPTPLLPWKKIWGLGTSPSPEP